MVRTAIGKQSHRILAFQDPCSDEDEELPNLKVPGTAGAIAGPSTPTRKLHKSFVRPRSSSDDEAHLTPLSSGSKTALKVRSRVSAPPTRAAADRSLQRSREQLSDDDSDVYDAEKLSDSTSSENSSPKKKPRRSMKAKAVGGPKNLTKEDKLAQKYLKSDGEVVPENEQDDDQAESRSQEARLMEMGRQIDLTMNQVGPFSSQNGIPRDAKDLKTCPFCKEAMPKRMSTGLKETMQHWLDKAHKNRTLPRIATLEACQSHRNEAKTIPEGKARGWRTSLDRLSCQVQQERNGFMEAMRWRVIDPSSSEFFQKEVEKRKRFGRAAESSRWQMGNLQDLQGGYFGERGVEILRDIMKEEFIDCPKKAQFDLNKRADDDDRPLEHLTALQFVERVLVPELILMLITWDCKTKTRGKSLSSEEARKIRDESTEYGNANFPSIANGSVTSGRSVFGEVENKSPRAKKIMVDVIYGPVKQGSVAKEAQIANNSHSPSAERAGTNIVRRVEGASQQSLSPSIHVASLSPQTSFNRPRPRPSARKEPSAPSTLEVSSSMESDNASGITILTRSDELGKTIYDPIVISPPKSDMQTSQRRTHSPDTTPATSQISALGGYAEPNDVNSSHLSTTRVSTVGLGQDHPKSQLATGDREGVHRWRQTGRYGNT